MRNTFVQQSFVNFLEPSIPDVHIAQVFHRLAHIILATAKLALALFYKIEDFMVRQLARVLGMAAIDDEGQGLHRTAGFSQRHRSEGFDVNIGELFTLAEIGQRFVPPVARNFKHLPPAGATAVETKDEPWLVWCTAVLMRVDAETAMEAMESGRC